MQVICEVQNENSDRAAPMQAISLRPDMIVCFWEFQVLDTDQYYTVRTDESALWLDFIMEGSGSSFIHENEPLLRNPGSASIRYVAANTEAIIAANASENHRWLSVVLAPDFLAIAAPEDWNALPESITRLLSGVTDSVVGITRTMNPDQFIAASQLMACSYTGASRTLYLKSKTIELLAHMLADHSQEDTTTKIRLSSYEVACLEKAKNILTTNLNQPPGLKHLAAIIGLSETKLKSGFKSLFGLPVFEYYRKHRIDVARQLLLDSDKPISIVANIIGYANVGHFSAAFKECYGTTPSAYRRQNAEKKQRQA